MTFEDKIYVVIPTFNRHDLCIKCIGSIQDQRYKNVKIIVVDDDPCGGATAIINNKFPKVIVLTGTGKLWWAGGTNLGCEYAMNTGARLILTLNDDLILHKNYLEEMIKAHHQFPDAIIGSLALSYEQRPRLLYAGEISHNFWTAKTKKRGDLLSPYKFDLRGMEETITLPGRGTLIPRRIIKKLGLFDNRNFPQYGADYDFALRARKENYKLFLNTQAILYSHYKQTGTGNVVLREGLHAFIKSFFVFKSPNYIPVMIKLGYRHHPYKAYYPVYFIICVIRKVLGHIKHMMG